MPTDSGFKFGCGATGYNGFYGTSTEILKWLKTNSFKRPLNFCVLSSYQIDAIKAIKKFGGHCVAKATNGKNSVGLYCWIGNPTKRTEHQVTKPLPVVLKRKK